MVPLPLTPEQRSSGGHQTILYYSKLERLMEGAGFTDVVKVDFGLDHGPGSRTEHRDALQHPGEAHCAFYSLYVEATKP